ncbi:MAG: peptidoglycan bridge formation glycyltransferase FemA/FemB family protein [Candidatus Pacebacteria bacterium]|nr:peptidoglycan bridge formation glycyltransferase FemA/FemB family protein [Candidatus Paceibacterota bacterium]MDD3434597.1 peptidoglycan bridge formation glycyltransferase FemA/FemB family protein [Candidatus Paceibacterota bacterium]
MKVNLITENLKESWDDLAGNSVSGSFLQSFTWGDFKKNLGKKVWRLAVVTDSNFLDKPCSFLAISQVVEEVLFLNFNYLYVPYGPIFQSNLDEASKKEVFTLLKQELKKIASQEKSIFVRIEPKESLNFDQDLKYFKDTSLQPLRTLFVDLKPSISEIMASFRKETRYDIRLAEKNQIEIRKGKPDDLMIFINLLRETAQQHKFNIYSENYYVSLYHTLISQNMMEFLIAEKDKQILGGLMGVVFKKTAVYLFGATASTFKNLGVSYLLLWSFIKIAKEQGCQALDLWGVGPENDSSHPWSGFTKFKRGFATKTTLTVYPGSYFLVTRPLMFQLYLWQKSVRRKRI